LATTTIQKITLKIPKWNDWPLPDIFSAFPVKWAACHSRTISGPPSSSSIVALAAWRNQRKRDTHISRHSAGTPRSTGFDNFLMGALFFWLFLFFWFFVFSLLSPVLLVSVFLRRKKISCQSNR
jgi:hypothetical protein